VGEVGLDTSDDVSCDRRPAVEVDACSGFEDMIKDSFGHGRTWLQSVRKVALV
jgi:hypothetical protein